MAPPIEEDWFERPLASSSSHSFQFVSRSSLLFSIDVSAKENEILYKSSPGFEPTTFLIHDLSIWRLRPLEWIISCHLFIWSLLVKLIINFLKFYITIGRMFIPIRHCINSIFLIFFISRFHWEARRWHQRLPTSRDRAENESSSSPQKTRSKINENFVGILSADERKSFWSRFFC